MLILLWFLTLSINFIITNAVPIKRSDDVTLASLNALIQQQASVIQALQADLTATKNDLAATKNDLASTKSKLATTEAKVAKTTQQGETTLWNNLKILSERILSQWKLSLFIVTLTTVT